MNDQRNSNVHPLFREIVNTAGMPLLMAQRINAAQVGAGLPPVYPDIPPGGPSLPPIYVPDCIQPQAMSLAQRIRMSEDARMERVSQEVYGDRRPAGRPADEDDGETADERYDAAREHEMFRED